MQAPARAVARPLAGAEQGLVVEEAAVGDRVVDPGQVLLDDRAGAEVEVADLGVAHLSLRQADVTALGGELGVRELLPEPVEDRGLGKRDRVAGPGSARPQPSRMTSASEGRTGPGGPRPVRRTGHAASTIAAKSAGSRLAPPTRAPSMSGWPQQLGGVGRLDRAAVEDPHLVGGSAAVLAHGVADEGARLLRLLGGGGAAGADRPDRLVGDHHLAQLGRPPPRRGRPAAGAPAPPRSVRPRVPPSSRRRRGSARGRRPARRAPCVPGPRRSRRRTDGARSGRG